MIVQPLTKGKEMKYTKLLARLLIVPIMTLSGCSSYNPVQLHHEKLSDHYSYFKITPPLYAGDVVELKHKNGSQENVTVQSTTPHAIVSTSGQTIEFADITSLKRKDFSIGKTVGLVGAGVGVTLVICTLAFAALITKCVVAGLATV